jgi:beta-lactamase class D
MRKTFLAVFLFILFAGCSKLTLKPTPALSEERADLAKYFDAYKVEGAFVLYDLNANRTTRYNPSRCAEQFLPASTYKIVNALIALETGVATDADYVIKWSGQQYPVPEWNRDQTLRSALQYSVVWYYQELARREGQATIQKYIDAIGYGNRDIGGSTNAFWLDGNLRISANEQINLLVRLYKDDLPFSKRNMDIVKDILVREKKDGYTLRAKFGSTTQDDSVAIGWYIGYLEKDSNVYFFATNISSPDPDTQFPGAREAITHNILKELGILQ